MSKGKKRSPRTPLTHVEGTLQTCDILPWRFKTYLSASGRNDVLAFLERMDDFGQEHFKRQVAYLAGTAYRTEWTVPQARKLKGYVEIYEIRFQQAGNATRALGFFGPEPGVFTITLVATHKQDDYNPRDALNTAERRRADICAGRASAVPLVLDGEEFPPLPD